VESNDDRVQRSYNLAAGLPIYIPLFIYITGTQVGPLLQNFVDVIFLINSTKHVFKITVLFVTGIKLTVVFGSGQGHKVETIGISSTLFGTSHIVLHVSIAGIS